MGKYSSVVPNRPGRKATPSFHSPQFAARACQFCRKERRERLQAKMNRRPPRKQSGKDDGLIGGPRILGHRSLFPLFPSVSNNISFCFKKGIASCIRHLKKRTSSAARQSGRQSKCIAIRSDLHCPHATTISVQLASVADGHDIGGRRHMARDAGWFRRRGRVSRGRCGSMGHLSPRRRLPLFASPCHFARRRACGWDARLLTDWHSRRIPSILSRRTVTRLLH
jgi:hypothetical protein